MIKPQLPNIPGVGMVSDTFDFVKNLWGSMNVPGLGIPNMVAPTLSVEELDKKIGDLKAVESWLNVNMSMLRGTIQALEVQRGTIATLKSMSATLSAAVKQPSGAAEKSLLESIPYASAFLFPNAGAAASAAEPLAAQLARQAALQAQAAAMMAASAVSKKEAEEAAHAKHEDKSEAQGDFSSQMANPIAWWNVLQEQFKQAVNAAVVADTVAKLGAAGTAMATDAVVKLGEAAANAGKALTEDSSSESDKASPSASKRKSAAAESGGSRSRAKKDAD